MPKNISNTFERISTNITRFTGSSTAFFIALAVVILWLVTGPIFNYSNTWQLIINTGTTIITFLMVFLIQKTQNKDSLALQIKLNELLASEPNASNRMVDIENLTEAELRTLDTYYAHLAQLVKRERDIHGSHSIDAAVKKHNEKMAALRDKK
jgi:low affinity Fe/Cu permease